MHGQLSFSFVVPLYHLSSRFTETRKMMPQGRHNLIKSTLIIHRSKCI